MHVFTSWNKWQSCIHYQCQTSQFIYTGKCSLLYKYSGCTTCHQSPENLLEPAKEKFFLISNMAISKLKLQEVNGKVICPLFIKEFVVPVYKNNFCLLRITITSSANVVAAIPMIAVFVNKTDARRCGMRSNVDVFAGLNFTNILRAAS